MLEFPETDVRAIETGLDGVLRLTAFPERALGYQIERITPLARQSEGRNFFRVEARLNGDIGALRPGMEGVSRTTVEERRLGWVLFHDLVDWARLAAWAWLP